MAFMHYYRNFSRTSTWLKGYDILNFVNKFELHWNPFGPHTAKARVLMNLAINDKVKKAHPDTPVTINTFHSEKLQDRIVLHYEDGEILDIPLETDWQYTCLTLQFTTRQKEAAHILKTMDAEDGTEENPYTPEAIAKAVEDVASGKVKREKKKKGKKREE